MTTHQDIKTCLSGGNFAKAIALAEKALTDNSPFKDNKALSELLYLLAVAQRFDKQLSAAIETNQRLLTQTTENARAWQELGHCYVALQQKDEAARHFYKATQLNPALIASWRFLHGYYKKIGNPDALRFAEQQLESLSSLP